MEIYIRKLVCLAVVLALSACTGVGTNEPAPESLVQRHIEVAYGSKGIDAETSITMEGRLVIESFDVNAPMVMKVEAPAKRYFRTEVMGQEVVRTCKAGRCWTKEVGSPVKELHGAELQFMAEIADFHRLKNLNRYYRHLDTTGVTEFNGEQAYELQLTRNNGLQDTWYFSTESGLWLGGTWRLPRQMGGIQVTQYFEDYQMFNGMQIATEITEVTPEQRSTMIIEEVSFADIPDSVFEIDK